LDPDHVARERLRVAADRVFNGWAASRANRDSEYRPCEIGLSPDRRGLVVTVSWSAHERRDEVPPEVPDWVREEIVGLAAPMMVLDISPGRAMAPA
jgi:hypothetical protein